MKIYEDSNKSYPSMLVRRQFRLFNGYVSNNPFFRKLTSLLLNFLLKLLLLKLLICGNDYLTLNKKEVVQKEWRKKCYFFRHGYLNYLLNKQKI